MDSPESVDELVEEGARLLADYVRDPRTSLLRKLAPVIVELRSRYTLEDGRPDWGGRSPEYRAQMASLYNRAGVPKDQLDTVQAAMRYHIGNLLRERASSDELLSVGLTATAPRQRNSASREAVAALAAAAGGKTPRADVDRLAVYAQAILDFLDEAAINRLPADRSRVAQMALERVRERAEELLSILASVTPSTARRGRKRGREDPTGGTADRNPTQSGVSVVSLY